MLNPRCPNALECGSFLKRERVALYPEPILRSAVKPGSDARCTFYVTKARAGQHGLPADVRAKPYTLWSLCQGGRIVTGHRSYATLREARTALSST